MVLVICQKKSYFLVKKKKKSVPLMVHANKRKYALISAIFNAMGRGERTGTF